MASTKRQQEKKKKNGGFTGVFYLLCPAHPHCYKQTHKLSRARALAGVRPPGAWTRHSAKVAEVPTMGGANKL